MTNKQRYQRTFSTLHASEDCLMEVKAMKPTKKIYISRLSVACAAVVMAIGLASVVYAADVGGIQRNVQIWIDGDKTDAVLDIQGTSYTVTTAQSPSREIKGGGVAFNDDGSERPLTEDEIMEHLNSPDVEYEDDGSVWVSARGEKIDITDRFDEDGVCYVQLNTEKGPVYLTVKFNGGFASSPHSYVSPKSFNTGAN